IAAPQPPSDSRSSNEIAADLIILESNYGAPDEGDVNSRPCLYEGRMFAPRMRPMVISSPIPCFVARQPLLLQRCWRRPGSVPSEKLPPASSHRDWSPSAEVLRGNRWTMPAF